MSDQFDKTGESRFSIQTLSTTLRTQFGPTTIQLSLNFKQLLYRNR